MYSKQHPFPIFHIDGDAYLGTIPKWQLVKRLLHKRAILSEFAISEKAFPVIDVLSYGFKLYAMHITRSSDGFSISVGPNTILAHKNADSEDIIHPAAWSPLYLRPLLIPLTKFGRISYDLHGNKDGYDTVGGALYTRTGPLLNELQTLQTDSLPNVSSLLEIGDTNLEVKPISWYYLNGCLLSRDVLAVCDLDALINCGWLEYYKHPNTSNYLAPVF